MAYGNQGHVGISFQNSFGTSNVASHHYFPFISESLTEKIPRIISEAMMSRYEEGPKYNGQMEYGGDLVTEVHPILLGKMLKAWCGQASTTLMTSNYTHTFNPRQTAWDTAKCPLPPMSIEVYRDTGSGHLYSDMALNDFSLEISQGKLLRTTYSFIGANGAKVAKSTPSYLVGSYFSWNQCSLSLGGTGTGDISNLTIKGSNALESKATLDGTQKPNRIVRKGSRTLEISGTILLDTDAQKDIFRAGTAQRLVITVGGSSDPNWLKIDIPSMVYDEFPDNIGGPGILEVSFKAKADYNQGSATMVTFTLINSIQAY